MLQFILGYVPNSVIRGMLEYKPVEKEVMEPPYRPPEVKHMVYIDSDSDLDMYCWLLDRVHKKCKNAGIRNTHRVLHVVTKIFHEDVKKTEEATRTLVEHLRVDRDFDLMDFLTLFSDHDSLRERFGPEIYSNLFCTTSILPNRQNSSYSPYSSLSSPSTVHNVSEDHDSISNEWSASYSRTTLPSVTEFTTSHSLPSVRSAMKLKWKSASEATDSMSQPPARSGIVSLSSLRAQRKKKRLGSSATKTSLTIPSESSFTFSPSSEDSTSSYDEKIKPIRSTPRKSSLHSILSPKKRVRPASVTFATPLTTDEVIRSRSLHSSAPPLLLDQLELSNLMRAYATKLLEGNEILNQVEKLLRETMLKPWFPKEFQKGDTFDETVDNVFQGVCEYYNKTNTLGKVIIHT